MSAEPFAAGPFSSLPMLSFVLDVVLILAMGGLWFLWMKSNHRQRQLQSLLLEASGQLDTATRHLNDAMQSIERVQQTGTKRPRRRTEPAAEKPVERPARPADAQATRILRMRREGESPEMIADKLQMPLAQVKLMLKLHSPIHYA